MSKPDVGVGMGAGHLDQCVHFWRIDTPSGGPTCRGVCVKCGLEKDFKTVLEPTTLMRLPLVAQDG